MPKHVVETCHRRVLGWGCFFFYFSYDYNYTNDFFLGTMAPLAWSMWMDVSQRMDGVAALQNTSTTRGADGKLFFITFHMITAFT